MELFAPILPVARIERSAARILTPLGSLVFQALVDGDPLAVEDAFLASADVELRRLSHPALSIEIATLSFTPRLPERLDLGGCAVAVWRVRAFADVPSLELRAAPSSDWTGGAGDPESGEGLVALTWYAPHWRVSVGTTDEQDLASCAKVGKLPPRLAYAFDVDHDHWPRWLEEIGGIGIALPPLRTGESLQIHFVVAWKPIPAEDGDASTWLAVDAFMEDVSKQVAETLGVAERVEPPNVP